jgi:hypothetical protein
MLKKATLLTLVCLVVSLWPGASAGTRLDEQRSRHIGGLGRAAILVTTVRVRHHGGSLHESEANRFSSHSAVLLTGRPCRSGGDTFYTLPSHRVATHLTI